MMAKDMIPLWMWLKFTTVPTVYGMYKRHDPWLLAYKYLDVLLLGIHLDFQFSWPINGLEWQTSVELGSLVCYPMFGFQKINHVPTDARFQASTGMTILGDKNDQGISITWHPVEPGESTVWEWLFSAPQLDSLIAQVILSTSTPHPIDQTEVCQRGGWFCLESPGINRPQFHSMSRRSSPTCPTPSHAIATPNTSDILKSQGLFLMIKLYSLGKIQNHAKHEDSTSHLSL